MPLVRMHNKKTGVTYIYESVSYWDKEKKQPRNKRKLIGKLDPVTGDVVPTSKVGKKNVISDEGVSKSIPSDRTYSNLLSLIDDRNKEITKLKEQIRALEAKCVQKDRLFEEIRNMIEQRDNPS